MPLGKYRGTISWNILGVIMEMIEEDWINNSEILSDWMLFTDKTEENVIRMKVIGGWLVYRDLFNKETELVLTSTVIFISDPEYKWEV